MPLHAVRDGKGIVPACGVMQQPDTREGCKPPAYLFLSGVPAAEYIPEQIRVDMVVVLSGQRAILELQSAVMDACADRGREPLADGKVVRGFHPSEKVFATERRAEKGSRAPGHADKPVAGPGDREHYPVEIDGRHGLKQFRNLMT